MIAVFFDVSDIRTDRHTPEQRKRNMQSVRSKDSKIELKLRRALWAAGVRYRLHVRSLPGNPDLVMARARLVIFVDSEFWHGHDWEHRKHDIKSNKEFWITKIERNISRDIEVTKQLESAGWKVLRFWGMSISRDVDSVVSEILKHAK